MTDVQGDRPSSHIESMGEPLSEALWSPDFVMQAIEVLPVSLREGRVWSFRPEHADSFVLAWPTGAKPEEIAAKAMVMLELEPVVLHSTSWRHAEKEVVLTYLAVVPPDADPPPVRRQNKWDKRGAFKACNLDANRLRQFSDLPTSVRLDSFASPPVSSPVWRLAVRGTYPPA